MSADFPPVTVQYFKYDGSLHWRHDSLRLGVDDHGVWLGAPAGSIVQRGEESPIAWPTSWVQLVAPDAWWTMIYNGGQGDHRIYADIVVPAQWAAPDRVELIDLDLDVIGRQDGSGYLDDEDEFEEHRIKWRYPPDVVAAARTTAAGVLGDVATGREPFGEAGARWLDLVT